MVNITLEEKEKISIELLLTGKFAKQQSNNLFVFFGGIDLLDDNGRTGQHILRRGGGWGGAW